LVLRNPPINRGKVRRFSPLAVLRLRLRHRSSLESTRPAITIFVVYRKQDSSCAPSGYRGDGRLGRGVSCLSKVLNRCPSNCVTKPAMVGDNRIALIDAQPFACDGFLRQLVCLRNCKSMRLVAGERRGILSGTSPKFQTQRNKHYEDAEHCPLWGPSLCTFWQ
jgi:hypothetical protein